MGKTLLQFFAGWSSSDIAQLYIHSEIPTDDSVCQNYYRFTDIDAMISIIFPKREGKHYESKDIQIGVSDSRTDKGIIASVYQKARKRSALIYIVRNLYWRLSNWDSNYLNVWIHEFSPDVVFLASGDYGFIYNIAQEIAEHQKIPLVVSCVDDFYVNNKNNNSVLGKLQHRAFLKTVHHTMQKASFITTICEKMSKEYADLFQKPCHVLYTPASYAKITLNPESSRITYIGNLGYRRHEQLIAIGKALLKCDTPNKPDVIDIYSSEPRVEIIKEMNEVNGIRFHGQITAEQVLDVTANSIAVIHTESFDREIVNSVRYSISTKIAETLAFGPCLIAYGPIGIASIDYLIENDAAYVITSEGDLVSGLTEIISNPELRNHIIKNARKLARKNHDINVVPARLRQWLQDVVDEYAGNKL